MARRAEKRGRFLKYQALFSGKRSRLAALILDGTSDIKCQVPLSEVHDVYKEKWETVTPFKGLGAFTPFAVADNDIFMSLITEDEVRTNLAAIKTSSAPGPDKIRKRDIEECIEIEELTVLFNIWYVTGEIPDDVKQCRSILIPKSSDHLEVIGNWRPITIGSMILRLFSRILTKRLAKALPISPRQRGFIEAPGCSENLLALDTIIKQSKRMHEQLAVVFIDIAKAFDSVSHEHILQVLRMTSLDSHMIGIIQNSYVACRTSLEVAGDRTPEITIKSGVKQGDPMSPLLFNISMDPLLTMLEREGEGFPTSEGKVATLAFADDLVMLSHSWDGMSRNITILEKFCELTGLKIQAKKCHGFVLTPTHDSYTVNDCNPWKIGGHDLHMIQPEESERYLGVGVSPWVGIAKPDIERQLHQWIQSIDEAPLKPSQKVVILKDFAVPRFMYHVDHAEVNITCLAKADGLVREATKAWLRLPKSTCDSLLYSRCSDGGLGMLRLARIVPSIQARRIQRVANSEDATIRNLLHSPSAQERFGKLWVKGGGVPEKTPLLAQRRTVPVFDMLMEVGPTSMPAPKVHYPVPCDWRKEETDRWTKLPVQGMGIECFLGDKISNTWLKSHEGFRERHFIAALQLRANVYPNRETLGRGRKDAHLMCRKCSARVESSSHILGQCPAVQGARIARHNKICAALVKEARRLDWEIYQEPRLKTVEGELRKPDLVFVKDQTAMVIDVTVRWEYNAATLSRAAFEKIRYYSGLREQIKALTGAHTVHFRGFPIGARGKWHEDNTDVLLELGTSERRAGSLARHLSRRTLLYSLDILAMFSGNSAVLESRG